MTQAVLDKPAAATFPCFTEEHDMIRETVKKFARNEIAPHSADWDEAESFPRELFKQAAETTLRGILAYEERPLVSIDFLNDPHSAIVDAPSTMVIDGTQVKILAWYDNEWGYVNRMIELARKVAAHLPQRTTAA